MKKAVKVGNIIIGGDSCISVQSMLNTPSSDFDLCAEQVEQLVCAGCDIVRMAVTDNKDLTCARKLIAKFSNVPFVADIQFDYRLAVQSSDIGFHKIRINPGNIGGSDKIKAITDACKSNGTAIRVGVNGGSVEKTFVEKYGFGARALSESALNGVALLEKYGFDNIVISAKSSSVKTMVEAYRLINAACDYPLHIGVTESGRVGIGTMKSAIGIGALLLDGIGDTVRVSLTGDPVNEISAALDILKAVNKRDYCEVVSCPTCSRCHYNMNGLVDEINELVKGVKRRLKIAIMGCVVNGPGEARDADYGIAGGGNKAVIFCKGKVIETLPYCEAVEKFKQMIGGAIADIH